MMLLKDLKEDKDYTVETDIPIWKNEILAGTNVRIQKISKDKKQVSLSVLSTSDWVHYPRNVYTELVLKHCKPRETK